MCRLTSEAGRQSPTSGQKKKEKREKKRGIPGAYVFKGRIGFSVIQQVRNTQRRKRQGEADVTDGAEHLHPV